MNQLTNKQKIEIAGVILVKTTFRDNIEKILKDCKVTKEQARECLNFYIKKNQSK